MDAESIKNTLNFTTTYPVLMKPATELYLNKIFQFAQSWGKSHRVQESFSTQFQPFLNTSINTIAYLMHHLACHHWSNKTGNILGSSGQKITQKQLKMIVSPGRKVFENLKLQNYISDINKYCQVCIPP